MEVISQFHTPVDLPPEKEPPGTRWTQVWVCLDAVARRKDLSSCRELNPGRLDHSLLTILTELLRLRETTL